MSAIEHDQPVVIQVVLDVVLDSGGESPEFLRARLEAAMESATGDGLLTGDSAASAVSFKLSAVEVPPAAAELSEDEIAAWIFDQIECGGIPLEDIPATMARFAMSSPAEIRREIYGKMAVADADAGAAGQKPAP